MKLKLSTRCQNLVQSEIRSMSLECEKIEGINLSQGVCDLKTPSILIKQAEKALRQGLNYYNSDTMVFMSCVKRWQKKWREIIK